MREIIKTLIYVVVLLWLGVFAIAIGFIIGIIQNLYLLYYI